MNVIFKRKYLWQKLETTGGNLEFISNYKNPGNFIEMRNGGDCPLSGEK